MTGTVVELVVSVVVGVVAVWLLLVDVLEVDHTRVERPGQPGR